MIIFFAALASGTLAIAAIFAATKMVLEKKDAARPLLHDGLCGPAVFVGDKKLCALAEHAYRAWGIDIDGPDYTVINVISTDGESYQARVDLELRHKSRIVHSGRLLCMPGTQYRHLLHECGHILGLGHSADTSSVMHRRLRDKEYEPKKSDVDRLKNLYAGRQTQQTKGGRRW